MIRLRPYKPGDAWNLLEWWENAGEEDFLMWSCGEFSYPLTIEELDGYFCPVVSAGDRRLADDGPG